MRPSSGEPPATDLAAMPQPDFPAYGIQAWNGLRVIERWSRRGPQFKEIALGHGPRWEPVRAWLEVATFHPRHQSSKTPQEWGPRKAEGRLEMELQDLSTYGALPSDPPRRSTQPLTVQVDGRQRVTTAWSAGPVTCCATTATSGSLLLITWYGDPPADGLNIGPVADLGPYVAGTAQDQRRRAELFTSR